MILGIDKFTVSDIVMGRSIDAELLSRYELLHQLVTGRTSGVLASIDQEQDIRVKIAQQRPERNSWIKAVTTGGQAWNGYLTASFIGAGGLSYGAAQTTYAAM